MSNISLKFVLLLSINYIFCSEVLSPQPNEEINNLIKTINSKKIIYDNEKLIFFCNPSWFEIAGMCNFSMLSLALYCAYLEKHYNPNDISTTIISKICACVSIGISARFLYLINHKMRSIKYFEINKNGIKLNESFYDSKEIVYVEYRIYSEHREYDLDNYHNSKSFELIFFSNQKELCRISSRYLVPLNTKQFKLLIDEIFLKLNPQIQLIERHFFSPYIRWNALASDSLMEALTV